MEKAVNLSLAFLASLQTHIPQRGLGCRRFLSYLASGETRDCGVGLQGATERTSLSAVIYKHMLSLVLKNNN